MKAKPLHTALLILLILWCGLLVAGSVLLAFMGMMFAGEPAGGGVGVYEFLQLALPLLQAALLSAVLLTLWRRQFYVWTAVTLFVSIVFVIYCYYGWFL